MSNLFNFFCFLVITLFSTVVFAQMPTVQENWWKPNGQVFGIEVDTLNQKVYVGGDFDYIGPDEPYIGMVDTSGIQGFLADHPDGEVEATISDGKGGWFIGGRFSYVGDSARAGLAHLDSRGKVTNLFKDMGFNNTVNSLSLNGDTLFVGGNFSSSGKFRLGVSFIDTLNGKVDFSFPAIKGAVGSSVPDGNGGWYIGGNFTKVGDSLRNGYAHITATGSITSWNPIHNYFWGTVLGVKDQFVYIAGRFTEVDGQPRKWVAAVHKTTGRVNQWAPDVTGDVRKVAFYGDSIFLGGEFRSNVHNNGTLVLFDTVLGVPSNWDPNIGAPYPYGASIDEMKIMGDKLYFHGKIDSIGGVARDEFAAIDLSTKTVSSWDPTIYSRSRGMLFFNDKVYIYGEYLLNPHASSYCFVEYDTITGTATNTNRLNLSPVDGSITSAYYYDGQLYINGRVVMTQFYSTKRTHFKFNTVTWDGAPWGQYVVNDDNGGTFSGGNFLAYGDHSSIYSDVYTNAGSKYLKAVSISNDTSTIITPNANGNVRVVKANEKGVFIGGDFDSVGVYRRYYLAKLNANSLAVEPWNPSANGVVQDIVIDDTTLFVVGDFLIIGGVLSQRIAAIRLDSAIADPWIAGFYNGFEHHSIAVMDSLVFTAGKTGGVRVFNKYTKTANLNSYYNTGGSIRHLGISNNILYGVGTGDKPEVRVIDGVNVARTIPFSVANGEINDLAFFGDKVFVGGDFDKFGGVVSRNLVSLDISTGRPDTSRYNKSMITKMTSHAGKLYLSKFLNIETLNFNSQVFGSVNVGGINAINTLSPPLELEDFKAANGNVFIMGGIEKIIPTGLSSYFFALDEMNSPGNSGWISYFSRNNPSHFPKSVLPVGDSVFIGGGFTQLDTALRTSLCVLDDSIGTVSSFNVPVNSGSFPGWVDQLSHNRNSLFIGGRFNEVGGVPRFNMAKINLQTHAVESFNPSVIGKITHMEASDSIVFVSLDDYWDTSYTTSHYGLVGLDPNTGNIIPNGHFEIFGRIKRIKASENLLFVGGLLDSDGHFIVMGDCAPMISNDTVVACDSYTWINGITYYESVLNDSFMLTAQNGCDSTVILNLTINRSNRVVDSISACTQYTWIDGNTYYADNNTAQFTLTNQLGCDSVVNLELTITNTHYDTVTICNEYTWRNGVTYYSSNVSLSDTVSQSAGCDSIFFLNLTILDSNSTIDTISACDSITWVDGNTYTSSNYTAIDTLINSVGCDSIVHLDLTLNYSISSVYHDTGCLYYTWIDGNNYLSSTNSATYIVPNAVGCDSVITLNLILNQPTSGIDVQSVCDSLTWIDGVTYYSSNNSAVHVLPGGNANGCDSTVSLNLTLLNSTVSIVSVTACDSFTWNGATYTSSTNTPTDTLTNIKGCDSVINLNLTITNSSSFTEVISACDNYTWINGITYYSSNNTAVDTLINSQGCDSIVFLDLTIESLDSTVLQFGDTLIAQETGVSYQWMDCMANSIIVGETNAQLVPSFTGSFKVALSNGTCHDTSTCFQVVKCDNQANFSWVNNGVGSYSFTNNSVGNQTQWYWSFGDGVTDTLQNVSHTFQNDGNFVVILTTKDVNASANCISYYMDTISVSGVGSTVSCQAGFSVYYDTVNATVNVVNSSIGSNLSYSWDFGDGNTSPLQFPSHSYATGGPFNLCLTVSDGAGCSDTFCDSIVNTGVWFRSSGFDLLVEGAEPSTINLVGIANNIRVYPNPVQDQVNIEITNWPAKMAKIVVRDVSGKQVYAEEIEPISNLETIHVNTTQWARGTYFVEVGEGFNKIVEQIVVQ